MQPIDPSLFRGPTKPGTPDAGGDLLPKGTDVWYLHRSGAWQAARVTAVDDSMRPPFYQIEILEDGTVKDTERPRLRKRLPEQQGPQPQDAKELPGASLPSSTHLQPAVAGSAPSPAHATTTAFPGVAQNHAHWNHPPPGTTTTWPQHTGPQFPAQAQAPYMTAATQYHSLYPAQYPPAQMPGSTAPAGPATHFSYQQAQPAFQPGLPQGSVNWPGGSPWQQTVPSQQPYSAYMPSQLHPHYQQAYQQSQYAHHHSMPQPGLQPVPHQYGPYMNPHDQARLQPGLPQPGVQPGWHYPQETTNPAFSQYPRPG